MSYFRLTWARTRHGPADRAASMSDRTRVSSKGQVVLPKSVREAKRWTAGTELVVEATGDGVLLRPARPFAPTRLDDVASSVAWRGRPKTLADFERAIARGARKSVGRG